MAIGAAAAVTAVGAAVAGQRLAKTAFERTGRRSPAHDRWHSVTVNRAPEDLRSLPEPLAELGGLIEVRVRPAPGGRGTELSARLREDAPAGGDTVWRLRRALREAKQRAELGEVVLPDASTGDAAHTRATFTNRPLAYASRHGKEGGRL